MVYLKEWDLMCVCRTRHLFINPKTQRNYDRK